ncbi:MAG: choice-of-anchor B family protein [Bacteroidia bacterium]
MKKLSTFFLLSALLGQFLWAQVTPSSHNMQQLGYLLQPNWLVCSNLWGYVANDGTEYAIIGTYNGVSIVSLANPSQPVEVQFLPGQQTIWREIKTYSHYAYVSNEAGDGLRIIDLAGLPGNVVYKDTTIAGIVTSHTVSLDDGFLYVNGYNTNGGTIIFDLKPDPWNPVYMGEYNAHYVHDCYIRDNTLYAGEIYDGLLTLIDVTNKANPQAISSHSYTNSFTHNTWLNDASNVCFTTDEYVGAYVYAWDISNPQNIQYLDKITSSQSGLNSMPHNIHVKNDYGVTSYYQDGVVIFDVARPHNLVEVAHYDTYQPTGSTAQFDGAWGVYPYLPSGIVIASDMSYGLYVLQPTYQRACYLEGIVNDAVTNNPVSNVAIDFQPNPDSTNNNGNYAVGTADAGTYSVTFSKYGYYSQTHSVNLSNGQLTTLNIQLQPLPNGASTITVLEAGTNQPIENALIQWVDPVGLGYNLVSNASGTNTQNIAFNQYQLVVGKWGYRTSHQALNYTTATNYTVYLTKGYYDDFHFDYTWEVGNTATSGAWVRVKPTATYHQNTLLNCNEDVTNDGGDKCFVTGNNGLNDEVKQTTQTLKSPVLDLTTYANPVIKYKWWFANKDTTGQTVNDSLVILLEPSNGGLPKFIKSYKGLHNSWTTDSFCVLDYAPLTNEMRLRIRVKDDLPNDLVEAGIDMFEVIEGGSLSTLAPQFEGLRLQFAPNPMEGQTQLSYFLPALEKYQYELEISDLQGKMVQKMPLTQQQGQHSLQIDAASGIYFASLKANGARILTQKLVKY